MSRSAAISQYHACAKRHNCPGEYRRITGTKAAKRSAKMTTKMMRSALKAIRKQRKQARGVTGRKAIRSSPRNKK